MSCSIGGIGTDVYSMQQMREKRFNEIDAGQDGKIRFDEIMDTLDIDGDGTISQAEDEAGMAAMMQAYGPPPMTPESFFETADVDGDGSVKKEEFLAAMESGPGAAQGAPDPEEIFSLVDTDGNGMISKTEDEEWLAEMARNDAGTSSTSADTSDALYQALLEVVDDEKQAAALARIFTTAIETYAKNLGTDASDAAGSLSASVSGVVA